MNEKIEAYKERICRELEAYMEEPITQYTIKTVCNLTECLRHVKEYEACLDKGESLSTEDAEAWNAHMVNEDGTLGGKWTVDETTAAAATAGVTWEHITPICWNVTMNMMYSDYCKVAEKYGVNRPEFYAGMAKAFLFDRDGGKPKRKLAAYYWHIAAEEKE